MPGSNKVSGKSDAGSESGSGKSSPASSKASQQMESGDSPRRPLVSSWRGRRIDMPLGETMRVALPGYSGHIPRADTSNIIGHTWAQTNETAWVEMSNPRLTPKHGGLPSPPASTKQRDQPMSPTRGSPIFGYKGHLRGVYSENVVGMSSSRAVEVACAKIATHQKKSGF